MHMTEENDEFLTQNLTELSGVPARIVRDGKTLAFPTSTNLPCDPYPLFESQLSSLEGTIGYRITKDFYCFAYLLLDSRILLIGPTRHHAESDEDLRYKAIRLGLKGEEQERFVAGMRTIPPLSLERLLQMLLLVDFLRTERMGSLKTILTSDRKKKEDTEEEEVRSQPHNTLPIEALLHRIVREGNRSLFENMVSKMPSITAGLLSQNYLRQAKNTFIVTATLVSRYAIEGGLDANVALELSDLYIQKAEAMNDYPATLELQLEMIRDYIDRVAFLRIPPTGTKLSRDVANYVSAHLMENIRVQDIASSLFLSVSALSHRFHKDVGETLKDYILKQKIERSKKILLESDWSIATVSHYLAFSSQSHFTNSFRKITGISPRRFRLENKSRENDPDLED